MSIDRERLETVRAAFRNGAQSYARIGSPLYSALCAGGENDDEVVELAAHAMAGSQPVFHLLASVHHLLMADPSDPLARFFATLTDTPLPPVGRGPTSRAIAASIAPSCSICLPIIRFRPPMPNAAPISLRR